MRLERHEGYWLLVGPAAPGATATTLGPLILMRPRGVGNARLLRHELEHVRQWREQGVFGFLHRYLGAYLRQRLRGLSHWAAYRRIPHEIEAEWLARLAEPPGAGALVTASAPAPRMARPARARRRRRS
ncbi:MAG: DUF4157 domain-containing protein [Acidimicrobiales bacterium]|nr:DUF4157 domain-containing protein [Acidimicrobiales bacterium]